MDRSIYFRLSYRSLYRLIGIYIIIIRFISLLFILLLHHLYLYYLYYYYTIYIIVIYTIIIYIIIIALYHYYLFYFYTMNIKTPDMFHEVTWIVRSILDCPVDPCIDRHLLDYYYTIYIIIICIIIIAFISLLFILLLHHLYHYYLDYYYTIYIIIIYIIFIPFLSLLFILLWYHEYKDTLLGMWQWFESDNGQTYVHMFTLCLLKVRLGQFESVRFEFSIGLSKIYSFLQLCIISRSSKTFPCLLNLRFSAFSLCQIESSVLSIHIIYNLVHIWTVLNITRHTV